jgi:hypothetical protein
MLRKIIFIINQPLNFSLPFYQNCNCNTLIKYFFLHSLDTHSDDSIILKWILEKRDGGGGGLELNQSGSGLGQVAGSCECGNEPSGSMKLENLLPSQEEVCFTELISNLVN